jgi:Skp family chaperone for outer membrane proteins
MKKISLLLLIIFSIFALQLNVNAQKKSREKLVKIGAVDLQKVFEKSPGKKIAEEQLEKKREEFESKRTKSEEDIKELQAEFDSKKYDMSDDERKKAEMNIDTKTLDLKKYIDESNSKLEAEENKLLEPIVQDIKDVIRSVSILYGYDIILDKSTYILYIDKNFDITDEVIDQLKVKYKN